MPIVVLVLMILAALLVFFAARAAGPPDGWARLLCFGLLAWIIADALMLISPIAAYLGVHHG